MMRKNNDKGYKRAEFPLLRNFVAGNMCFARHGRKNDYDTS